MLFAPKLLTGRYIYSIIFFAIVLIAFAVRFYALGSIPPGLTNDEADIGYDAYSILLTGKDQWGQVLPLTSFKGFGDYRLPLYTYLVVPFIKIFDLTSFAVRLPSVLSGVLSTILIYFLAKKLFEHQKKYNPQLIGLISGGLMAITPWSVGLSRIGIESNLATTVFLGALLCFLYGITHKKLLILSAVLFVMTIYTYTSYTLFTPLALVALLIFYRKELRKLKKYVLISAFIFGVLVLPLILGRTTAGVRVSQVGFINSQDNIGLIANLNDMRGNCQEKIPNIFCRVIENKQLLYISTFTRNYINHFSPSLLYLSGTTTQYSILPDRSLLYTFELILFILGLFYFTRSPSREGGLLVILLLLSPIPDSLTGNGHYSRAAVMMPLVFLIEAVGGGYLVSIFKKSSIILKLGISALFICAIYSIVFFFMTYSTYFPKQYSIYSQYGYRNLMTDVAVKKDRYEKIYISRFLNDTKQYIYYLFYNKIDPRDFQKMHGITVSTKDGWISVDKIGNVYFIDEFPAFTNDENNTDKVLLIAHPKRFPENTRLVGTIKDTKGQPVFIEVTLKDYKNALSIQKI